MGAENPQLVLLFGGRDAFTDARFHSGLKERYADARLVSVSAPEMIAGEDIVESGGVATVVQFENATIEVVSESLSGEDDGERAGRAAARRLTKPGLRHVLVFSEGININGTALIRGLGKELASGVSVTGGLASDGDRFKTTVVGLDVEPEANQLVLIGLYGASLKVGMGSLGGWEPFGEEMEITRSEGNRVYTFDGESALAVYKRMLGARAYGLPASGLLNPLNIKSVDGDEERVRTLLGIDEADGSVSFAGDVPQGFRARMMTANLDRLIDAAGSAATLASQRPEEEAELVLLISCIGRKLLLQTRAREEVRSARKAFGPGPVFAGFYSYGEISPLSDKVACELHNQTMTITSLSETRVTA